MHGINTSAWPVHLRQLVSKDFKLKYRRSILGVVWSFWTHFDDGPLWQLSFLRLGNRAEDVVNYPLYLILGNTAFQLMNDATTMGMRSIIDASGPFKKVRINRVVFLFVGAFCGRKPFFLAHCCWHCYACLPHSRWQFIHCSYLLCCFWLCFCISLAMLLSALTLL